MITVIKLNINIISLGRLGLKLHHEFSKLGHDVKGSYCNTPKGTPFEVQYDYQNDLIPHELMSGDILIFNLTPSAIKSIELFEKFINTVNYKRVIFISSTSVYGEQGRVSEDTQPISDKESGKFLLGCEKLVNSIEGSIIIRPAGIIYNDSHPAKYMSGREVNIDPSNSVNLIMIDDLSDLIIKSLDYDYRVINAVNTYHPQKGEYYLEYCKKNNLAEPHFEGEILDTDKIITSKYPEFEVISRLP